MLRTLCSGDKDTTVAVGMDHCHLGKACVYTGEDAVQLREESEWLDKERVAKAKVHQEQAAAKVLSSGEGSKSFEYAER